MAKIPQEVQALFNEVPAVVFCTATANAQPNGSIVGMKRIVDDETIFLSDQFFKKTLANAQANEKVSVVFWQGHDAYQLYGTVRYANEGEEFLAEKKWVDEAFANMGAPMRAKGGCFIHVEKVFCSTPGPLAGELIG